MNQQKDEGDILEASIYVQLFANQRCIRLNIYLDFLHRIFVASYEPPNI